jgi:phage host-nuclease inhibitor protein Gam
MKKNVIMKNWQDVDWALSEIGDYDLNIEKLNNTMKIECKSIKNEYEMIIAEQEEKRRPLMEAVEAFFRDHEADVKGRTWEGALAKCGLRLTPPALKPSGKMTWERVLARILDLGYKSKFLRPLVHTVRDIDREALGNTSDDVRREVGVKIEQDEKFWYEVKPKV